MSTLPREPSSEDSLKHHVQSSYGNGTDELAAPCLEVDRPLSLRDNMPVSEKQEAWLFLLTSNVY